MPPCWTAADLGFKIAPVGREGVLGVNLDPLRR